MKIAILGGTFDPIHIGHIIIADSVITQLCYDKILFIPASIPPHKKISGKVSDTDRLNMVKLSIEGNKMFDVCDYELLSGVLSYTINTLEYIYQNYKNIEGKIGLIIGFDLVDGFSKWREARKISDIADIIVVNRNDSNEKKENEKFNIDEYNMKIINTPNIEISSTLIRENIFSGKSVRYFLRDKTFDYIVRHNLYK